MIPKKLFTKEDSNDDSIFYTNPRLVKHIDENACQVLKDYYDRLLKDGDAVLDLMSSWVSHLPDHKYYSRVSGQGMNQVELQNNSQLTEFYIQNLNNEQRLPFGDEEFKTQIEQTLEVKIGQFKQGRPINIDNKSVN